MRHPAPAELAQRLAGTIDREASTLAQGQVAKSGLLDMVLVEGGTFAMGDTFGDVSAQVILVEPVHAVTLSSFYLSKYEVTFQQHDAFCDEVGSNSFLSGPADFGRGGRPVMNVSWYDAVVSVSGCP